jgi:hypothetical protein
MTTLGLGATVALVAGIMFWMAKAPAAQAQQQDERVLLHIEVTDNKGHYINGIQPKDFRILEDSVAEKIDTFAENENSYNISYFPARNPNEGFRKIEVQIVSDVGKEYRVRHKLGYTPHRPVAKNSK